MGWYVNISLKSNKYITVENLQSISKYCDFDGSVEKITDFEGFVLPRNQRLTFTGNTIAALSSSEIEYVELNKKD